MSTTTGIISELFRHELLRTRRDAHFLSNIVARVLQLLLWIIIAFTLPYALKDAGINPLENHLLLLVFLDQAIRLLSQKTPDIQMQQYALLPVRKWQVLTAYLARMLFVPANLIWLYTLWNKWWLFAAILLSGYLYLALWHTYKRLLSIGFGKDSIASASWGRYANGLLACEIKMRLRLPALRTKIRNSLLGSLLLMVMSLYIRQEVYTDFAVLYTLLFPSLPMFVSRLGYEQAYMGLLSTRMQSLLPLYKAKYMAAILLLLPCTALLILPVSMGLISVLRLISWALITALLIYPALLFLAPHCKVDSPQSQILTAATLTIPVLLMNICTQHI